MIVWLSMYGYKPQETRYVCACICVVLWYVHQALIAVGILVITVFQLDCTGLCQAAKPDGTGASSGLPYLALSLSLLPCMEKEGVRRRHPHGLIPGLFLLSLKMTG